MTIKGAWSQSPCLQELGKAQYVGFRVWAIGSSGQLKSTKPILLEFRARATRPCFFWVRACCELLGGRDDDAF